jgi:hypothetical protein
MLFENETLPPVRVKRYEDSKEPLPSDPGVGATVRVTSICNSF